MVAIDQIFKEIPDDQTIAEFTASIFPETDLYVTVEPCIMCAAALRQLGIRRVYFGCGNDRFGGNGTVLALNSDHHEDYPPYEVVSGIFRKEAIILLRSFYIQENDHAPEPKKKCNRVLKIDDI
jgi:tRNA-specific adenosine deaminase 2